MVSEACCGPIDTTTISVAAGTLIYRTIKHLSDRERQSDLLNATRNRGARQATVLEREGELSADRLHHNLSLWVLQQRSGYPRQITRSMLARI